MQEMVTWFTGKFADFFSVLASLQIVSGVSVLHFLFALMVICMLIRSFLHVSR